MELAKDIFYFVGSLLGILAFLRVTSDALAKRNYRAWEYFRNLINEDDLRALEYQIEHARRIDSELLNRLGGLVRTIRQDDENLRFGPLLETKFAIHLHEFVRLYDELRQFVQVPWWQPKALGDGPDTWDFEKSSFFSGEYPRAGDYADHLNRAAEVASLMRHEYRALSVLANLDLLELPFASRLVKARAALPVE